MSDTAPAPYRVACSEYAVEASSYSAAFRQQFEIEGHGACRAAHRIEGRVEGVWIPGHLALASTVLTAKVGTVVETFDGPLTKYHGSWSKETAAAADAAGEAGTPEWYAALGAHEAATLTSDGRGALVEGWCSCGAGVEARYERWSARGREAHGLVCKSCRCLTQTG